MTTKRTKRGRAVKERVERGPGRARPLATDIHAVRRRLESFIRSRYESVYEFTRALGLAPSTVQSWIRREAPKIPDASSLIFLARATGVSLNWLVLGEGPDLLGATATGTELAQDLRSTVVAELISSKYAPASAIKELVPAGNELLEGVLQECRRLIPPERRRPTAMMRAIELLGKPKAKPG